MLMHYLTLKHWRRVWFESRILTCELVSIMNELELLNWHFWRNWTGSPVTKENSRDEGDGFESTQLIDCWFVLSSWRPVSETSREIAPIGFIISPATPLPAASVTDWSFIIASIGVWTSPATLPSNETPKLSGSLLFSNFSIFLDKANAIFVIDVTVPAAICFTSELVPPLTPLIAP